MNPSGSRKILGLTWRTIREWLIFGLCLAAVSLTTLYNYLLFHSLAEIFSIVIAASTFFIAWNARHYFNNRHILYLGIAFLFVSIFEALHLLTYKGLGVIVTNEPTNLPTQLWIASRYMISLSFVLALTVVKPKLKTWGIFAGYSVASLLLMLSIFYWKNFPTCYIEDVGLTSFKIASEYIIAGLFAVSIVLLIRKRTHFDSKIHKYLVASIVAMIMTELAFSQYVNVYGQTNLIGHLFLLLSFYLLYKSIIETGLTQPYSLLFRDLKQSQINLEQRASQLNETNTKLLLEKSEREQVQKEIEEYRKHLEELVKQRTQELSETNQKLEIEIAEKARLGEELRTLSTRTIESLEEERQLISRELHDETGQALTVLSLQLSNLKRAFAQGKAIDIAQMEEAQEIVKEVMGQIRALSSNLHPGMLDNIGLIPTLVWYTNEFTKRTGIKINFDHSGSEGNLSSKVKLTAYRIIQESLTNITRYAGVDEAFVQIRFSPNVLQIYIEDEGKGFDLTKVSTTSSGIRGMRERALSLGGSLDLSSLPGEGTRLEVNLPVNPEPDVLLG